MGVWRHLRAIVLLPGVVAIVIPASILARSGGPAIGWGLASPWALLPSVAGLTFIGLGLLLWIQTVLLFARIGLGTLAPWDPTQRLVVRGVYRHVRNPMISAVCAILLGEAILSGSRPLFAWLLLFVALNAVYIPLVEEASLTRRFGADYARYRQHVPRWLPLLRPWDPDRR